MILPRHVEWVVWLLTFRFVNKEAPPLSGFETTG